MVFLPFGVADGWLEHGYQFGLRSLLQSDEVKELIEGFDTFLEFKYFVLEFFFLFVGELAEVEFIFVQQQFSWFPFLANFSDEQLVEAEHLETGDLRLEHYLDLILVNIFLDKFIDKFWDGLQDP